MRKKSVHKIVICDYQLCKTKRWAYMQKSSKNWLGINAADMLGILVAVSTALPAFYMPPDLKTTLPTDNKLIEKRR